MWLPVPLSPYSGVICWWFLCWCILFSSKYPGIHSSHLLIWFFNVLYNFGLQSSYMLGYCWLFTLFLGRLSRCFSHVQVEVDSTPTYLITIFCNNIHFQALFSIALHHKFLLSEGQMPHGIPCHEILFLCLISLPGKQCPPLSDQELWLMDLLGQLTSWIPVWNKCPYRVLP